MQAGYFKTAWSDIKSTPGWVGKMFLLALIMCIPIFGQIVVMGYLYGWARDAAWGVQGPMPKRIFGNEDGKLYSRGFFILVLGVVLSLIPGIVYLVYALITGLGASGVFYGSGRSGFGMFAFLGLFGLVFLLLYWVLLFAMTFFLWVGSMRISIYGRLSAGFQFKKVWAMIRKDFVGLLKIFGMVVLASFILGIIAAVVFGILFSILFAAVFSLAGSGASLRYSNFDGSMLGLIFAVGGISVLISFILAYLILVPSMWIQALAVRALGYWTKQFDVPAWRGQDDPMPFEIGGAAPPHAPPTSQQAVPMPQQPGYQSSQQPHQQSSQQNPTASQAPSPQAPLTQVHPAQASPAQAPSPQASPTQAPSAQASSDQTSSLQARPAQAPPDQAPSAQSGQVQTDPEAPKAVSEAEPPQSSDEIVELIVESVTYEISDLASTDEEPGKESSSGKPSDDADTPSDKE